MKVFPPTAVVITVGLLADTNLFCRSRNLATTVENETAFCKVTGDYW